MKKTRITAVLCAVMLSVQSVGAYNVTNVCAATVDAQAISEETTRTEQTVTTKLEHGKGVTEKLHHAAEVKKYEITLQSSGKLTISVEGEVAKLSGQLVDKSGKCWEPVSVTKTDAVKRVLIYELKKGTYTYQVGIAAGAELLPEGLTYTVTEQFQSAKAKYEKNTTMKKAQRILKKKDEYGSYENRFKGHLAENAPSDYYKFTLKKMSICHFSMNTQVTDLTPNTFVLSLYNEAGRRLVSWENPEWGYSDLDDGIIDKELEWTYESGYALPLGMLEVLPAGTYYIQITAKTEENGTALTDVRYGEYEFYAFAEPEEVSLKLSPDEAV